VIDEHINRPWPPEVAQALAPFKQGDLLEKPPFFYGRHPTIELVDAGGPGGTESQVHELHPDDAPPYGIITTQTCDLNKQGTPTQPWFQVSPVYVVGDERILDKAYAVELTGPPADRFVADLRIELPLEKSLLVGREPIPGFATDEEAEAFGRLLGQRRARHSRTSLSRPSSDRSASGSRTTNRGRARCGSGSGRLAYGSRRADCSGLSPSGSTS
jgi:hypothetical protein